MDKPSQPSYMKGFLWLAFSATATFCAFVLPIHIFALTIGFSMDFSSIFLRIFYFTVLIAALYHGLYRTKTILLDIGLIQYKKTIGWLAVIVFLFYTFNAASLFFFSL